MVLHQAVGPPVEWIVISNCFIVSSVWFGGILECRNSSAGPPSSCLLSFSHPWIAGCGNAPVFSDSEPWLPIRVTQEACLPPLNPELWPEDPQVILRYSQGWEALLEAFVLHSWPCSPAWWALPGVGFLPLYEKQSIVSWLGEKNFFSRIPKSWASHT